MSLHVSGIRRFSLLLVGFVALTACGRDGVKGDRSKAAEAARAVREQKAGLAPAGGEDAGGAAVSANVSPAALLERAKPIFGGLPTVAPTPDNAITDAKVELGRMLYYETRLSKNQDLSCNSCHDLASYGVDVRKKDGRLLPTSMGHKDQLGDRNAPTVYNAAFHIAQFWDGRAEDVEEQAKGPILNPVEMAMPSDAEVEKTLASIPGYVEKFEAAFPDEAKPITYDNLAAAIGAFERKLITPASFDRFMDGDLTVLDDRQLRGLKLFMDVGCVTCHTGPTLGGNSFQKLGSVKPWPDLEDVGRQAVTKSDADKFAFKVPSLRNVTKTGPYLHDGSIATLEEMVRKMATYQTARGELRPDEVDAIVAFLGSLEGEIPKDYIAKPTLPESGPDTPGPDPS